MDGAQEVGKFWRFRVESAISTKLEMGLYLVTFEERTQSLQVLSILTFIEDRSTERLWKDAVLESIIEKVHGAVDIPCFRGANVCKKGAQIWGWLWRSNESIIGRFAGIEMAQRVRGRHIR